MSIRRITRLIKSKNKIKRWLHSRQIFPRLKAGEQSNFLGEFMNFIFPEIFWSVSWGKIYICIGIITFNMLTWIPDFYNCCHANVTAFFFLFIIWISMTHETVLLSKKACNFMGKKVIRSRSPWFDEWIDHNCHYCMLFKYLRHFQNLFRPMNVHFFSTKVAKSLLILFGIFIVYEYETLYVFQCYSPWRLLRKEMKFHDKYYKK